MHIDQIWTLKSGNTLGTFQENITTSIDLPISQPTATVEVISGKLPKGFRLDGQQIIGTPAEVAFETKSRFVLRAEYNGNIYDRTFNIIVQGSDVPEWITPADLLPVGANDTYYVLDNSFVDFQLEVEDPDIKAGQELEFSIGTKAGQLPPGLSLTKDGRITGIVDPILAIEKSITGGYDVGPFDYGVNTVYDWFVQYATSGSGFDSYFYDLFEYDLSFPGKAPKKLNRYFQFVVSVSDGEFVVDRSFRIFVVGDDFFTADVTTMQAGTGAFTADVTNLRAPYWLTPRNFGYRRANNYIHLPLQVIDNDTFEGLVWFRLEDVNDDNSPSILPPGLGLDFRNGIVIGRTPYQPKTTQEYKFTVTATRVKFDSERVELQQIAYENTPKGAAFLKINKTEKVDAYALIGRTITVEGFTYKILAANFTNANYELLTLSGPTQTDIIQGTGINLGIFDLTEPEEAKSTKTFTVTLLGEVNSEINWITDSNLGSYGANYVSLLKVEATTPSNSTLLYSLQSGSLPPGFKLNYTGEIFGTVRSFGNVEEQGLTVIDGSTTTFDGNNTRLDREFKFTVAVKDLYGYNINTKEFTITIDDPNDKQFSNIWLTPLFNKSDKDYYHQLINNNEIFPYENIFRPNDTNFGIPKDVKVLLYSGIETKNIEQYVSVLNLYSKRKQYRIGDIKTAVAKELGTQNILYEVVYADVIDPSMPAKGKTKKSYIHLDKTPLIINDAHYDNVDEFYDSDPYKIRILTRNEDNPIYTVEFRGFFEIGLRDSEDFIYYLTNTVTVLTAINNIVDIAMEVGANTNYKIRPRNANVITVDFDLYSADATIKNKKIISNIQNLRDGILPLGETEKDFLPLWMQTPQNTVAELGYVPAIVLCYCKPGKSQEVIDNIKKNKINLKELNLDIDRALIDNTENSNDDQFIVFQNKEYVV